MGNSFSIAKLGSATALLQGLRAAGQAVFAGPGDRNVDRRNAVLAFLVRVASAGILFLSQVALARWMGAAEYGSYVYAWTWVLVLGGLATLGVNFAAIRFVSEYKATGSIDKLRGFVLGGRVLTFTVATGIAIAAGLVLAAMGSYNPSSHLAAVALALLAIPAFTVTDVQDGIGRGSGRMAGALFAPYILRPLLVLGTIGAAHVAGLDMDAARAALAAVAATWIAWAVQTVIVERQLRALAAPGPRVYEFALWFRTALPLMLISTCDLGLQNTDVILISNLLSPAEAGIYFAAAKTMGLIVFVHYAVGSAMANRFSALSAQGDRAGLEASVRDAVRWTFWPSLALGLFMLVAGRPVLSLFGPQFVAGYPVMCVLVVAFLARAAIGPVDFILNMSGGQAECARSLVIAAVLNLVLGLTLIPLIGMMGAAVALSVSLMLGAILNYRVACRRLGFDIGIWAAGGRTAYASPVV